MNNIHNYDVNLNLTKSISMSRCENFSSSASSIYEEISPHHQNSTPVSNDSSSDRHNQSTASSKKSEVSDDTAELTVDTLERTLTDDRVSKIDEILALLACLNDREKALVQLRFPVTEKDDCDDVNVDMGGPCDYGIGANQNEHSEALTWVMSHLEEDQTICLKKQEVYEDYKSYCLSHNVKYLSTADFGKVMKKAFPDIKARRLGARGQSKYCYSGLKNRNEIKSPTLIDPGLNCGPMVNSSESGASQDKNSDRDSVSSNLQQQQQSPDLSNVAEYELSHSILVDAALVILDFVKRVGLTREVTSLRQAVEHLLLNNQVDMRTPHAVRLLPIFQKLETQKSKKKHLVEQVLKTVKKEEILANPSSVHQYQSVSAAAAYSPQGHKRQKLAGYTPPPSLPPSVNSNYCHPPNANFHYAMTNNNVQQYFNHNPVAPNHMSPNICQKPFMPNTFSTPNKDSQPKIISPTLNSPLLERNPTTTKKLELSNSTKSILQSNSPGNYPTMPQQRTPIVDKSSKLAMFNSPLDYRYEPLSNQETINANHLRELTKNAYFDCGSPIRMTTRNYDMPSYDDEFDCDDEKYDAVMPLKRHIKAEIQINYGTSPALNHFGVDSDYGNLGSTSSGQRHQSGEENDYLETPGNSPTNRSTYQDPSEISSGNHTPLNCSTHLSMKDYSLTTDMNSSYPITNDFIHKDMVSLSAMHSLYGGHIMNYGRQPLHAGNDESSVSSTTNTCALDSDRHHSSTMLHGQIYK